jgi:hypothetical protein
VGFITPDFMKSSYLVGFWGKMGEKDVVVVVFRWSLFVFRKTRDERRETKKGIMVLGCRKKDQKSKGKTKKMS